VKNLLCDMMFMHCKDVMFTLQTDLQNRNGGAHQILRGDTHLVTAVANDDVGIGVLDTISTTSIFMFAVQYLFSSSG